MPLCFIAVVPPEPLRKRIRVLKEEFRDKYSSKRALRLPAHITLKAPFKIDDLLLPALLDNLKEFSDVQSPFQIHLSQFGAFPPKVIFIEVANPDPVKKLQRQLSKTLQKDLLPKEENPRRFRPHITLATRDLSRSSFDLAWKDLQKKDFSASFEADSVVLFQHNGKIWDTQKEFKFGNAKTLSRSVHTKKGKHKFGNTN